jgi:hypothetical protein
LRELTYRKETRQANMGSTKGSTAGEDIMDQLAKGMSALKVSTDKTGVDAPPHFGGKPEELQSFITRARMHLIMRGITDEAVKVVIISARLKGAAFDWFEPKLRDYMEYSPEKREKETRKIFGNFELFLETLKEVFGEVDPEHTAERQLRQLKQTGAANSYTAEFRRISSKMRWGDISLVAQFYEGLKDRVKDEIARDKRPTSLSAMIEKAIQIDNRHYERTMERKGGHQWHADTRKEKKKYNFSKKPRQQQWGDPMELDNVNRKPFKKQFNKEFKRPELTSQQRTWKEQGACLK